MINNHSLKKYSKNMSNGLNNFYMTSEYLPINKDDLYPEVSKKERPILVVIPELCGHVLSPCSYIRLLPFLLSDKTNAAFEVRFATLQSALAISADVIIINRIPCEKVAELNGILEQVRKIGTKLIYDIDDNLLSLPDIHPEVELYTNRQAVVTKLLSEADLVWVSTNSLAKELSSYCKQIEVFENYLSLSLYETKDNPFSRSRKDNQKFNILYMGTATHAADLSLVLDALHKLNSEGVLFQLYLIGISADAPKYSWIKVIKPPETANSYPKFMHWLRSLNIFDLGIAPLEETKFNHCKSAIKFWDYTSLGIPTLASDVEAYNRIVVDGDDGFLVGNDTADWYNKLRSIINRQGGCSNIVNRAKEKLIKLYHHLNGSERRNRTIMKLLQESNDTNMGISLSEPMLVTRETIAATYLSGEGIEIGALHNPLAIPPGAKVKYVDRMTKENLYEHYPELRSYTLVDVDIIDDGEYLNMVTDNSQDFVIANHFLEHSEDPIITLKNLLRVTKKGGVVYLAVPNMLKTFDCNRQQTMLSHIVDDHKFGPENSRRYHYEEWVSLVEPHFGRTYEGDTFTHRVNELLEQKYSIHFHCWDANGFKEFLQYLKSDCKLPFEVSMFQEREDEFISILTKRKLS